LFLPAIIRNINHMANERYLRFDPDIWNLPNVSVLHKLILNHVRSFEDKGLRCFTKPETLSEFFGVEIEDIKSGIEHLTEIDLLKIEDDRYLVLDLDKQDTIDDYFNKDVFEV